MGSNPCKKKKHWLEHVYKIMIIVVALLLVSNFLYRQSSFYYKKLFYKPIFSLRLNENDLVMTQGEDFKLFVYAVNKRISWSSTNFKVAFVNFDGRVYAMNHGEAFIIAKIGDKKLKCRVNVLELDRKKLSLDEGDAYHLRVLGNANFVAYKSSNPEVASISWFGKVKAKKEGSAVITVKARGKTLRCRVAVK